MRLLIVEDEPEMLKSIADYMSEEGYLIDAASNIETAKEFIVTNDYVCIVLDITLKNQNGLELINKIKTKDMQSGIIIVSAKNSLDDRIAGLDLGADDYLTKPFYLSELNSRVKSIIRRRQFNGKNSFTFNEIEINFDSKTVKVHDTKVVLTKKEYMLLVYLTANPNKVVSKNAINSHISGNSTDSYAGFDHIYSHMKNLKRKLSEIGCKDYIQTIYGIGYKFTDDEAA